MATSAERNKNLTRPKKSAGKRAKRHREHQRRLVALGMDESAVASMSSRDVLTKLKHPKRVAQEYGAQKG